MPRVQENPLVPSSNSTSIAILAALLEFLCMPPSRASYCHRGRGLKDLFVSNPPALKALLLTLNMLYLFCPPYRMLLFHGYVFKLYPVGCSLDTVLYFTFSFLPLVITVEYTTRFVCCLIRFGYVAFGFFPPPSLRLRFEKCGR